MSSTITTGRRFGRLDKDGKTYVAWFDTSYESNVHPHDPHENCVLFGSIEDIALLVAGCAHDAAGGMLRRPGSNFTAAGFIRAIATGLANPFRLGDREIAVNVGTDFRAAIHPDLLSEYRELMIQAGFVSEFLDLQREGKLSFRLHDKPELLALLAIPRRKPHVSAWRVLDAPWSGLDLPPAEPLKLPTAPAAKFQAFQIGASPKAAIVRFGDGTVFIGEPLDVVYEATSIFTENLEGATPGAGLATIKALEAAMKGDLPLAPEGIEIVINIREEIAKGGWSKESLTGFLDSLPIGSRIEEGYHRTTVGQIREQNAGVGFLSSYPFSRHVTVTFPKDSPEANLFAAQAA